MKVLEDVSAVWMECPTPGCDYVGWVEADALPGQRYCPVR